jgi:hypothetical protein
MSVMTEDETPDPYESDSLESLSNEGSKLASEREEERASEQAAAPAAAPIAGGIDPVSQALIQQILAGGVLGKQGETKGPEVMLTRDVKAPTYGITYDGDKSQAGNKGLGEYKSSNTSYGMTGRGAIEEVNEDYKDYSSGGFINNNNERINDGVILAAEGDHELYEGVFQAAVNEAAVRQSAGERITVEDVLQGWTKNGLPDGLKRGSGGGGGGGSRAFTNIDTRVDLTNEGEARRIVNNALTGALGREATKAESQAFMKALNMYEKQNPTVTTSKGVAGAGGTTSTTESEGGFDSADFADRYAKSQEGYAEYQTATTYLDAFISSLESDSRVI